MIRKLRPIFVFVCLLFLVSPVSAAGVRGNCQYDGNTYYRNTHSAVAERCAQACTNRGVGTCSAGGMRFLTTAFVNASVQEIHFAHTIITNYDDGQVGSGEYLTTTSSFRTGYASKVDENKPSCSREANPCDVMTGRKVEAVTDYSSKFINLVRRYDSGRIESGSHLGGLWKHSFESHIDHYDEGTTFTPPPTLISAPASSSSVRYETRQEACVNGWNGIKGQYRRGSLSGFAAVWENDTCLVKDAAGKVLARPAVAAIDPAGEALWRAIGEGENTAMRRISLPNGVSYDFIPDGLGGYREANGNAVSLTEQEGVYVFTDRTNQTDRFSNGLLISRTLPSGVELTIEHDSNGRINQVSDPFGNSLAFAYDSNNQLQTLTYPSGQVQYTYDAKYNLSSVAYEDNSVVSYHYENIDFPYHLTGITDQKGVRYATWEYDAQGRAISSTHPNGTESVQFSYLPDRTEITDAQGGVRTYFLDSKGGQWGVTDVVGDRCATCNLNSAKSRTYDDNGHLASTTDWEGNVTHYTHDIRGLEVSRTEAFGTALARTITTEWHPSLPLPVRMTEPDRITEFTYDEKGLVINKIIRAI